MTTPLPFDAAYEGITLGGTRFTGGATVQGFARKKKLDRRRAPGADGAHIRDRGYDLVEGTIVLRGWLEEHQTQMDAIEAETMPPPGSDATRRNAVDVLHPKLSRSGITQLYVTEAEYDPYPDGEGSTGDFTLTLKAVEYRPPPPRNVTRTPAAAADAGDAGIDPGVRDVFNANPIPEPSGTVP